MNCYERLGIAKLINVWDHLTVLGGSLMPDSVLEAMAEAAGSFVSLSDLHLKVGEKIAELTQNEAAYVTGGAAAGMAVAVAACITGTDPAKIEQIPDLSGLKNEVIMHRSQRNGYDHSVRQVGVKIVEIGSVEVTHPWQLEEAITANTACIFYFASSLYQRGTLPLEQQIKISRRWGVPVIVDAAAQLPPVENLWRFTKLGVDAAVFSGGKAISGPQNSGFVVGKKSIIEACRLNASPNYSIGRSMKIGKEEIIGLLTALERYLSLDHSQINKDLEERIVFVREALRYPFVSVERLYPGPTGQDYPRALVKLCPSAPVSAVELRDKLADGKPCILVGLTPERDSIIINPYTASQKELEIVVERIKKILDV